MDDNRHELRIAATADLHYSRNTKGLWKDLFIQASSAADVLLICGDLTDYGLPEEAHHLADDLHQHCRIPVVAVLGNHDFESGQVAAVSSIIESAGVHLLDGECTEIGGIGFVGVRGFGGGFGSHMLNAWGEPAIKNFVQESVDQALHLERALARVENKHKIVLLHYAPIRETVVGECLEVLPFLGSTRLEGPLNRLKATAVFHGHAHNGAPFGRTSAGIPVFNVSASVLRRQHPEASSFMIFNPAQIEASTEPAHAELASI